jgi:hypothetical protein
MDAAQFAARKRCEPEVTFLSTLVVPLPVRFSLIAMGEFGNSREFPTSAQFGVMFFCEKGRAGTPPSPFGRMSMKLKRHVSVGLWLLAGTVAMVIAGRAVVAQLAPPPPGGPSAGPSTIVTPVRPPPISPIYP